MYEKSAAIAQGAIGQLLVSRARKQALEYRQTYSDSSVLLGRQHVGHVIQRRQITRFVDAVEKIRDVSKYPALELL
jgi:hypothetical protein